MINVESLIMPLSLVLSWLILKDLITHWYKQKKELKRTKQVIDVDINHEDADKKILCLIQRVNLLKRKVEETNNLIEGNKDADLKIS